MALPKLAAFLQALKDSGLLEPAQLTELEGSPLSQGEDMLLLARVIVRRGWLTRFQVNQLAAGRGQELSIGPYRLLDRLGEGAMGQVFKAHHAVMNRTVALKVIRKEWLRNATAVARFYKEVQAAAQLIHPNIVLAYDAGQAGAIHYFAMEYVEGTDLSRLVEQSGPLGVGQACAYIRQAALGLQHAFTRGMVHRDIKPHNLLLARSANGQQESGSLIKILDMGLARLQGSEVKDHALTQTGAVIGTPDFIAPEQALNSRDADIRSDIYSLGCTLYYLLARRPPHQAASLTEVLLRHQLHEPTPIQEIRKDVPAGLAAVLKRMMAKQAGERYQTPAEVAAALAPFASLDDGTAFLEPETTEPAEGMRAQSTARHGIGSQTAVLYGSRNRGGLSGTVRSLRKRNPALFYGAAVVFMLVLVIAFLTPVLLARRSGPNRQAADTATAPLSAAAANLPAPQPVTRSEPPQQLQVAPPSAVAGPAPPAGDDKALFNVSPWSATPLSGP